MTKEINLGSCTFCTQLKSIKKSDYIVPPNTFEIALVKDNPLFPDLLLKPDLCPISKLHFLIVCELHITSLFDFLQRTGSVEQLEALISRISKAIKNLTGKNIIIFEHGSNTLEAPLSGSSINHLHLHVICEPDMFNYEEYIKEDNAKKNSVLDINDPQYKLEFNSIIDFKNSAKIEGHDYFLIWEPNEDIKNNRIKVYFPRKKESQYLRRIFYMALGEREKMEFYPDYSNVGEDDYYNWKKYYKNPFKFTCEICALYKAIGLIIEKDK